MKKLYVDLFINEIDIKLFFFTDFMSFEIFDKSLFCILNFIFFMFIRDFILKIVERLLLFKFLWSFDLFSIFCFHLKVANFNRFRYNNNFFHHSMFLYLEKLDKTFI